MQRFTRFILTLFVVLFILFLLITWLASGQTFTASLRPSIYYALVILGVPIAFRYFPVFSKYKKKRFQFFVLLLFIFLLYVGAILIFLYSSNMFDIIPAGDVIIAAELLALKYMVLNILLSFSIVYFVYALTVTFAPVVLNIISQLTPEIYGKKRYKWKGNLKYLLIGYLFNIPKFIDTRKLTIIDKPKSGNIGRKVGALLAIESALTALLLLYIGLNPFLPPDLSRVILIDISLNVASLIPLLVFPVYLLYMLKPYIPIGHRGFNVYKGMRRRLTGLLITATTILVIVRLAFERLSQHILLLAGLKFLIALPGLMLSTLIFIMIYEDIIMQNTIIEFKKEKRTADSFLEETEKKIKEWILER